MTALFNRLSEDAALLAMASDDASLLIMGEHGIENLNVLTGESKFVRYEAKANFDFVQKSPTCLIMSGDLPKPNFMTRKCMV